MFRHAKPIGAWGNGADVLHLAGIDLDAPGILISDKVSATKRKALVRALGLHRVWERMPLIPTAG